MTLQTIGVGTAANDHTGDPLRTAFTKINSMTAEIYGHMGFGTSTHVAFGTSLAGDNGSQVNIFCNGAAGAALDLANTDTGSGSQAVAYIRRSSTSVVGSIACTGTATSFNTSSDERLKNFTGDYDGDEAIRVIRADPVRSFTWNADGSSAIGWGVQTSHAVSPDLAMLGNDLPVDDPGFIPGGMDQSKRAPYLWAALARALDTIDDLTKRMTVLEAK